MFDYIYDWLKNLAFYMILVTAILQILPDNSYQKYIRFFTGLILVIILMGPILKLVGMKETFSALYKDASYRQETKEMEDAATFLRELENPLLEEEQNGE